jgi:DNA (cytosine-5)-methyltransferase 1
MTYSDNKLWKMLIDQKMTKTAMGKQAGLGTKMPQKMGRDEPVSMKALETICTRLHCGLDIMKISDYNMVVT